MSSSLPDDVGVGVQVCEARPHLKPHAYTLLTFPPPVSPLIAFGAVLTFSIDCITVLPQGHSVIAAITNRGSYNQPSYYLGRLLRIQDKPCAGHTAHKQVSRGSVINADHTASAQTCTGHLLQVDLAPDTVSLCRVQRLGAHVCYCVQLLTAVVQGLCVPIFATCHRDVDRQSNHMAVKLQRHKL